MGRPARWTEKFTYLALMVLGVGLASLWQYSKYRDGHGLALLLDGKVSAPIEILIFAGLPLLFVAVFGWRAVRKDVDRSV